MGKLNFLGNEVHGSGVQSEFEEESAPVKKEPETLRTAIKQTDIDLESIIVRDAPHQKEGIWPLYRHQQYSSDTYMDAFDDPNECGIMNLSDCGTGKTRGVLDFLERLKFEGRLPPVLVLGPLSILRPAWGNDIEEWTHLLTYSICYAKKREESLLKPADIHIINHDGVKFLTERKNRKILERFRNGIIIVDEMTAFKNPMAKRTKAVLEVANITTMAIPMSGTPIPNSVIDIFAPALLADAGQRLGKNFYAFRNKMQVSVQVGSNRNALKWTDKKGAAEEVSEKIQDMVIRFSAKDCLDLPENTKRKIEVDLPPSIMKIYKEMVRDNLMVNDDGEYISAVNAAAKAIKLIQLCSGAVYNDAKEVVKFHSDRYELVIDLVKEVEHSLVAFNFKHEREALEELAKRHGVTYDVIDGSVPVHERELIVEEYQAGGLDTIFCHPKSAGHGLTLTRGTRTIWASPTPNSEIFKQFNHRIDRAGQKNKTETIMICARGTRENRIYDILDGKLENQGYLLEVFNETTKEDIKQNKS